MQLDLLNRLLDLASPADAAELLQRVEQDLAGVVENIEMFYAKDDREPLRKTLHILTGISGSVGAERVFALAQQLDAKAADGSPLAASEKAELMQGIAQLREMVQFFKSSRDL